ncbi:sensor histidine kinase [Aquimarina sp. 2-A2]|uniref:sensor histidine kinase n=1 Tax=Aquimarina sp. 2-A2 TaxID=3382644 RepID=UPI00387F1908
MRFLRSLSEVIQSNRALQHILFWSAIFLLAASRNIIDQNESLDLAMAKTVSLLIPQILASYFFAYVVISIFIAQKKFVIGSILVLASSYFFLVLGRVLIVKVAEPLYREAPFEQETLFQLFAEVKYLLLVYSPTVYSTVFIFLFVKYFMNYKAMKQHELVSQSEKVASELKTLKSQLNPHFLFNTLNNIYVLSIENSPKAPKSIEKLSQILDYVLYRCNTKFVALSSEIEFIKNYIDLEKLRYDDRLQINFINEGRQEGVIAPLILLSLVENAFKHGAGEDSGSPKIDIHLQNSETTFKFVISNSVMPQTNALDKTPIGLKNIKKQLDLIYGNMYELQIDKHPNTFTVTLIIKYSN